jgi:flagella basal body P-ring formation protein FlgA
MYFLRRHLFGLLMLANCLAFPVLAAEEQPIRLAIKDFVDQQTKGLPGPVRYEIGKIAASGIPPGCRRISVSSQPGTRLWGRAHLQVRCREGANWSLFVPVEIQVTAEYLVTARPVRPGQTLSEADIAIRRGDLAELPPNVLTEISQAIGQNVGTAMGAEQPLRADYLRRPVVVRQGQTTRVVTGGSSFQVASEGKAMGNAIAGQVVQVRMGSGQTISGVAQADGSVRVAQ